MSITHRCDYCGNIIEPKRWNENHVIIGPGRPVGNGAFMDAEYRGESFDVHAGDCWNAVRDALDLAMVAGPAIENIPTREEPA